MAIIALKAWYLKQFEPLDQVLAKPPDLRLSRNSMLKSAMRADFLDDHQQIHDSEWFKRYLEGEIVEFYIEGSGGYKIANLDLISQEIYFTKQELIASLEPKIFLSWQQEDEISQLAIEEGLTSSLEELNLRSRLPLGITKAHRLTEEAMRNSDSQLRSLRKSLLVIADITPISMVRQEKQNWLIPHPQVCVEVGYAIATKRPKQLILLQRERQELSGKLSFDIAGHQQLIFNNALDLQQMLPSLLETLLHQFNLF